MTTSKSFLVEGRLFSSQRAPLAAQPFTALSLGLTLHAFLPRQQQQMRPHDPEHGILELVAEQLIELACADGTVVGKGQTGGFPWPEAAGCPVWNKASLLINTVALSTSPVSARPPTAKPPASLAGARLRRNTWVCHPGDTDTGPLQHGPFTRTTLKQVGAGIDLEVDGAPRVERAVLNDQAAKIEIPGAVPRRQPEASARMTPTGNDPRPAACRPVAQHHEQRAAGSSSQVHPAAAIDRTGHLILVGPRRTANRRRGVDRLRLPLDARILDQQDGLFLHVAAGLDLDLVDARQTVV